MNALAATIPPSLDIDFRDAGALADERYFPALAALREAVPVYWSEYQQGWLITRHADVQAGFDDPRLSSVRLQLNQLKAVPPEQHAQLIPTISTYVPLWIINIDGADHERIRGVVARAFSKKVVDGLRTSIQTIIDELLKKAARADTCDFVSEIAYPLPATVVLNLLGVSLDHLPQVRHWARDIVTTFASASPSLETILAGERALRELTDLVRIEIDKRRAQPQQDFLTELLRAAEGDQRITLDEMLGLCHVLFTAGHDTTVNSLAMGLVAWTRNPAQREQFLAQPDQAMQGISEMLRYIAMSSCQIRYAREDFDWHGQSIRAGDCVYLMIAAGNRDPRVFDRPEQFDLTRTNLDQSLTFGPGLHHCIGHLLGRVELAMFFQSFLRRYRVDLLDRRLQLNPNYAFRGLETLRVRFHPL